MSITLTKRARQSLDKIKKEPSLVLQFDGITEVFSSATAYRFIRIGDTGLEIGNDWVIGGKVELSDQITSITFASDIGRTSTEIDYKLNPDLGFGDSITSMNLAFVDNKAETILGLIANNEFLGRKCRLLLGPDPNDTVFPDDYIVIFRGIVDDMQFPPGGIVFTVSHTDQKKRQAIYTSVEGTVGEILDSSETTITLSDASDLLLGITAASGGVDSSFSGYIQIDDEIIKYTARSGNDLTVSRGELDTTAAAHSNGANFKSFYQLEGNAMDLALKIMLSGWNGPFKTGVSVTNFGYINSADTVDNSIFFSAVDVEDLYGLTEGDYVSATGYGAASANSFTNKEITDIVRLDDGSSYIVVDDTLTNVLSASGVVSFRSKYDTLPDGMKMTPDQVDVAEHERLKSFFLSSFDYNFYLKDSIDNGKEFLDKEIYRPIACYSVPRKARSSVAFTIGPLPTQTIKTLDTSNVKNANQLSIRRSLGRNFYNTIIYKYDMDSLEDKFRAGVLNTNATSRAQIDVGTRALTIESLGLRTANIAQSAATRRLNRYAYGAQYINNVKVTFSVGFNIEVTDLVLVDGVSLKLPDFDTGKRSAPTKYYEVISKKINFETGDVILGLVDTSFDTASRYALISPASNIKSGVSASAFIIEESFASEFGSDEYLKWNRYDDLVVRVRNSSYNTAATARVSEFSGNTVRLLDGLGFTPSAGMLMELSDYNDATTQIKQLYGFAASASGGLFDDGASAYFMI
jgi:hypothetical protein